MSSLLQGAVYVTNNAAYTWTAAVQETVDATLNRTVSSGVPALHYLCYCRAIYVGALPACACVWSAGGGWTSVHLRSGTISMLHLIPMTRSYLNFCIPSCCAAPSSPCQVHGPEPNGSCTSCFLDMLRVLPLSTQLQDG